MRRRRTLAMVLWSVAVTALGACDNATVPDLPAFDPVPVPEPSDVDAVVFVIGDGGATEPDRSPVLRVLRDDVESWSAALGRDSAVSVVYPGDIVYPVGLRDPDHPDFETDSTRLWNQIDVVAGPEAANHATLGLFLAGNHDWGNAAGPVGEARVRNLGNALARARDRGPRVALLPEAGTPGPVVRDLRRNVRLVFVDTHWFLQARSPSEKDAFFTRLEAALSTAGERHVIMFQHHPYRSAGPHDALLPGPRALGIPFLLKKTGTLVQDLDAPVYDEFQRRLRRAFRNSGRPPLVFAGGHDHSLQVLSGEADFDPEHVVVSGAGSKLTPIAQAPGLRYGASRPGYMYLVFRTDDAVDLFVVAGDPDHLDCSGPGMGDAEVETCMRAGTDSLRLAFSMNLVDPSGRAPARLADGAGEDGDGRVARGTPWWTPPSDSLSAEEEEAVASAPPPAVSPRLLLSGVDSVEADPGEGYPAGRIRRWLLGDLNRHLWSLEVRVPVLDLDSLGGGVTVDELSGGKQTLGLRLTGENGVTYQFRSIVKDASRLTTGVPGAGVVEGLLQDQMAAQFPLAAMVVAELLEAADVLVARPVPVVMPDHERLGPYRDAFAGRMGWIEVRPNEADGDRPGFAGSSKVTGSDELYEELAMEPTSFVDVPGLLRARLIDMLVGDWDRHSDQWRWASYDTPGGTRWEPIPRDRDWAFSRVDGVLPRLVGPVVGKHVGFAAEPPPVRRLTRSSERLERRLLAAAERDDYLQAARELRELLTDSVIAAAVDVLPPPVLAVEGDRLVAALTLRRDALVQTADEWYRLRAEEVDVWGTEGADHFRLERDAAGGLTVTVRTGGAEGPVRYERRFRADETDGIRLHWTEGEDVVEGDLRGGPIDVERVELVFPVDADG